MCICAEYEIILIVFIFLWSLFIILFFCLGKKKIRCGSIYFVGQKNNRRRRPKSGGFRERKKKKLDSLFILHTLYKAFTAGVVGVQKGRRRRL